MNATRFALPLLAATLALPSPSQDASCVLVVQFGTGDLVLNKPLLDAIANEPGCVEAVRKALGDDAARFVEIGTDLPAPHLAGTFQVHVGAHLLGGRALTKEQQDAVVDAMVGCVQERLTKMLFAQPQEQGRARREELAERLAEMLGRRAHLLARIDAAANSGSEVAQRRSALEQQLVAVRLDLATQQRAREQLDKLRAQYADARERLRVEDQRLSVDESKHLQRYQQIEVKMRDLAEPAKADPAKADEVKQLRVVYGDTSAALTTVSQQRDAAREQADDVQRMLTVILEQLPANMLDLQRAQARLDALAAEQKQLQDLAEAAAKQRADAAQLEVEAERLSIEISVTKTMLTEIEGKLARLQPVRYELLRRHR